MSDREFINPYPGTAPFQDRKEDRLIFFGRDREITRLTDMILSEPLVVLFARSGLGKSSLINAGVVERLRANDCFPIVARVTHNIEAGPIISIFDRIDEELRKHGIASSSHPDESSLWAYFEGIRFSRGERRLKPVLILDQFEELFTRLEPQQRAKFIDQFTDIARGRVPQAVRNDAIAKLDKLHDDDAENPAQANKPAASNDLHRTPKVTNEDSLERDRQRERLLALAYGGIDLDVKIVLSMREDFLAELEPLKDRIPLLLRNTMRLEPLNRDQAEEAIVKPSLQSEILGTNTVRIEPAAVKAMLDFLSGQQADAQLIKSDDIEPVQLQILCHSLYESARHQERDSISVIDLGGHRGMARILRSYYNKVVRRFPPVRAGWNARRLGISLSNLYIFNLPRYAIRRLCEDGLILASGFRNNLEGGYIGAAYGVPQRDLTELVDQRLLRSEARQHGRFYELSHDSLIAVLKRNRFRRKMVEAGAAGLVVLAVFTGIFAQDTVERLWLTVRLAPLRHTIASGNGEERIVAFKNYSAISRELNLPGIVLRGLEFREAELPRFDRISFAEASLTDCIFSLEAKSDQIGVAKRFRNFFRYSFKDAKISGTTFDKSQIVFGDFSEAQIRKTKFDEARLSFVSFRNADLAETDFSGAFLSDNPNLRFPSVDFIDAKLNKVNFTGADIRGVDFTGVKLDGDVDFTDTQWWMAKGWSDDQVKQLEEKFPHRSFASSTRYATERNARIGRVAAARDKSEKASGEKRVDPDAARGVLQIELNGLAWYREIHGVELAEAQREIDEALAISPDPSILDTKAYIFMQQGNFDEARRLLAQALGVDPSASVNTLPTRIDTMHPAIIYKYALTLDMLGEEEAAKAAYALVTYQPTHERLLVPRPERKQSPRSPQ